ncbi:MAG: hypothetical protein PHY08_11010 [Candidatus Cloacimonetes bacterium]|nr:hypothetical protein [Candidatus Cloacimonadota bacterium]
MIKVKNANGKLVCYIDSDNKLVEIARDEVVSHQAISDRLKKAIARLRKKLN